MASGLGPAVSLINHAARWSGQARRSTGASDSLLPEITVSDRGPVRRDGGDVAVVGISQVSRRRFWAWIARLDFIEWLLAIFVVSLIVGGLGKGVDWLDQRSCRVDGGRVVRDDADWRCEGRR